MIALSVRSEGIYNKILILLHVYAYILEGAQKKVQIRLQLVGSLRICPVPKF
jgi:hypothetical protein